MMQAAGTRRLTLCGLLLAGAACATVEPTPGAYETGSGPITRAELEDVLDLKEQVVQTLPQDRREEFLPSGVRRGCILDRATALAEALGDDAPDFGQPTPVEVNAQGEVVRWEQDMSRSVVVDEMLQQAIADCRAS